MALIGVFALGLFAGWYLAKDTSTPPPLSYEVSDTPSTFAHYIAHDMERVVELSEGNADFIHRIIAQDQDSSEERVRRVTALVEAFSAAYGARFRLHTSVIEMLHSAGQFESALRWIEEADLVASSIEENEMVDQLLDSVTESFASELVFLKRFEALDQLYEGITYTMPERARYFLKLGMLRIQMGNYDGAMAPLSQIQNAHGFVGVQARELIAQVETNNVQMNDDLEEVALSKTGNQFVIDAYLDRSREVRLLIDTGAAMTVINDEVIEALGYNLNGKPRELFSTANGVIEAPVVTLDELSLGQATISAIAVGALPLEMPSDVDGLLGMNFLRHYDFRIDQNRSVLLVRPR